MGPDAESMLPHVLEQRSLIYADAEVHCLFHCVASESTRAKYEQTSYHIGEDIAIDSNWTTIMHRVMGQSVSQLCSSHFSQTEAPHRKRPSPRR